MKAISLLQPWAGLVIIGMKRYETRSWNTQHRGPIAIHASAKLSKEGLEMIEMLKINFISRFGKDSNALKAILTTGAVLGEVNLVDTFSTNKGKPEDFWEQQFGDYSPNRFYWQLDQVYRFEDPIPAKGQLSIWNWDFDLPKLGHTVR